MTLSRGRIHELLDQSGLAPRRDLGQNFVADANTVRRIASLSGVGPGDRVVEIGAGLGTLTALGAVGVEVDAPAPTEHPVVATRQIFKQGPGIGT